MAGVSHNRLLLGRVAPTAAVGELTGHVELWNLGEPDRMSQEIRVTRLRLALQRL